MSLLFSASHVILRTVKAVPEYGKHKPKHANVGGEGEEVKPPPQAIPDENGNKVRFVLVILRLQNNLSSLYKNTVRGIV